ncbi:MAG: di-trans,poly-cis-decaprenylcistransferase [Puniceicoccales bacterium]|jgi:undecaprenyl diphosphate synthase|nr:di-trans,poly-cis-decaprenylcistransferase [Puniceicoccales bacterium]
MLRVPIHVALIMDGNGRWAASRGLPRSEGHRKGAAAVKKILRAAERLGIAYVTFYAFSSENFSRSKAEVDFLMGLFEKFLKKYEKKLAENGIRFRTIGDPYRLPDSLQEVIKEIGENTKKFTKFNLTIALNYGARSEVIRAIRRLCADGDADIDHLHWDGFKKYLDSSDLPDPDLIIRTSGEQRLSNFLMLQGAYAELYFTKTFWPDFGEVEFLRAVEDYRQRERRIGTANGKKNI